MLPFIANVVSMFNSENLQQKMAEQLMQMSKNMNKEINVLRGLIVVSNGWSLEKKIYMQNKIWSRSEELSINDRYELQKLM